MNTRARLVALACLGLAISVPAPGQETGFLAEIDSLIDDLTAIDPEAVAAFAADPKASSSASRA